MHGIPCSSEHHGFISLPRPSLPPPTAAALMQQPRGAPSPVAATRRHAERRDTQQTHVNLSKLPATTNRTPSIDPFRTGRRIHCIEWISASLPGKCPSFVLVRAIWSNFGPHVSLVWCSCGPFGLQTWCCTCYIIAWDSWYIDRSGWNLRQVVLCFIVFTMCDYL